MSSEIGEIKAGITLTAILELFDEIFVGRKVTKEGLVIYQVEGPSEPICAFRVEGDKIVFTPESKFGGKEKEIKELIEKRVGLIEYAPQPLIEKPVKEQLFIPVEDAIKREEIEPELSSKETKPIIPSTPGIAECVDTVPGSILDFEGSPFQILTEQQPIPSTSYMVSLGKYKNEWAVAVTRGRKVIGVEKISALETNVIIGAIQKIIVIPLFSPYAVSRAVGRLLEEVKSKK
ncbi:MAG: hypothetical protein OdinLCB4_006660 [Candidatus Odinarchaeum yellowstonii]|uniref:Uncharacterized protein n=1 Tax=Odinarchaeota yellowstonii (strain LCB_4) TaxID=1841599 RepID=A0AAF0D1T9_ODILC|nr:MAG: hypothetical protein OdinLCB4_006660 [Candidatus Odinarchaeum yellowstonii]